MYRGQDMWEEALRVAKTNGTQQELAEIAIKVAEHMGTEKGTQFLIKNGLIDAAIDFECNQERFEEAFKLAGAHAKYKLPDIHLKYALHLEDEHRYKEAEEEFIKANKPQEAINMYEHKQDWHSALQVARQYHPESVIKVFLNQARFHLERRDFGKAEQCYINAKDPMKAIKMYQDARMRGEALRVAQKHAPHMLPEIEGGYYPSGEDQSFQEVVNSAQIWEQSQDWNKAIDRYLEITEQHTDNYDDLVNIWYKPYNLAMKYCKPRIQEVVAIIGARMMNIGKFDSAADIYESVGYFEKAIDAYIECKQYKKATECARQVRPQELQDQLVQKIQHFQNSEYMKEGKYEKAMKQGDMSALQMLAEQGKWEECLNLAEKQGEEVLNNYLVQFARKFLQAGHFKETARVVARYGCPVIQPMLPVYKTISVEVLAGINENELQLLKDMLTKLFENMSLVYDDSSPIYREFYRYLMINHFLLLKFECQKQGIGRVQAKICTSLLRYIREIRPDKAFYDAGEACRKEGINNMAFMFFNRYLDLYDAIEDPDGANIQDQPEYQETDIPSLFEILLPEKNFLSRDERDKINGWVLEMNMEPEAQEGLSKRSCEQCGYMVYEASLACPNCRSQWEPCIVSGYPLVPSQAVQCKLCGKGALRDFWNDYIAATMHCPWCKSMQTQY